MYAVTKKSRLKSRRTSKHSLITGYQSKYINIPKEYTEAVQDHSKEVQ